MHLRCLLLVGASAALAGLAFPPVSAWPLMWVALVPLFVMIRRATTAAALLWTALWSGLGAYAVGEWFPGAVADYFDQPRLAAAGMFVAVVATMAGPYYVAFAAAYRRLGARFGWAGPWVTACAWVAVELGRGRLFTESPFFIGNPWGLLGYSQVSLLPLLQLVSLTGIYGVGFCVVAGNAAIAEALLTGCWRSPARALRLLAIGLGPGLLAATWGGWALSRAPQPKPADEAPRSAVIQANLDVGTRWRSDLYGKNLDVYLSLTNEAARAEDLAVVFWPEAAMTFFLEEEVVYQRIIAHTQRTHDLQLVAGGPRTTGGADPTFFNSIYVVEPDGRITGRYDKQYLIPFAEYFPLDVDLLRRNFGRVRTFARGDTVAPLETRLGRAGVVVCNEVMLPEIVSRRVAAGADYLVNPSNDSWIPDPTYTEQQLHIALTRAVEQRRSLVRPSTGGPSVIVDPWGRTLARSKTGERDVIFGHVPIERGRTVYARVGDSFAFACLAVTLACLLAAGRRPAGRLPATR